MYSLTDYDYHLPPERIAHLPSQRRDASRLLVLDRKSDGLRHHRFADLGALLRDGDVLVLNNTRVVPARLQARKETGGKVELLVLDPHKAPEDAAREGYRCLFKASKPARPGIRLELSNGDVVHVLERSPNGLVSVAFSSALSVIELLEEIGQVPLPPYIERSTSAAADDRRNYQTVYAKHPGAVAAPTAGLHFSEELLARLRDQGVGCYEVTLHVGYGTFAPIREEDVRRHRMHSEYFELSPEAAAGLERARREGRRIIAVGTTVVRTLEWVAARHGSLVACKGWCDHYIYPGATFQVVNAMITNFHLPKSTLLLLVAAFAGRERILSAYREAIEKGYRFYSYGDAMLIL